MACSALPIPQGTGWKGLEEAVRVGEAIRRLMQSTERIAKMQPGLLDQKKNRKPAKLKRFYKGEIARPVRLTQDESVQNPLF